MTARRVLFALLALLPLAELPGTGFDVLRLPLALALGAALLALGPVARPGLAGAALLALLGARALSLGVSADPSAGFRALLVGATAFAAYAAAREAKAEPGLLAAAAGVLLGVAAWQRAHGLPGASLLGNSNYAGAYAAMLLPALAAGPRNPLALFGAAAAGVLLALSESRGGLFGAVVGTLVAAALLWRGGRRREAGAFASILLLAASLAVAARPAKFFSPERLETVVVRFEIWKGGLRLGASRPLLGAGAGGFAAAFPPYRSAEEARITQRNESGRYPEVDNAHSSWVQSFAEGGFLGALAWLALVAAAARRIGASGVEGAGWAGVVAAFFAAGLFNTLTDHVSPMVLFGAALGFLEGPGGRPAPKAAGRTAAAALGLGCLWTASLVASDRAYTAVAETPAERERVLRSSGEWRFRFRLGEELARQGRPAEAVDAFRSALEARPFHAVSLNNLAVALLKAKAPGEEVDRVLARAAEVAPHYHLTHFNLGLRHLEKGQPAAARAQFERAAWLNETHPASRYEIGATYVAEGDIPAALPHLRRAKELGVDVLTAIRREYPARAADPRLEELRR
ncbi:MAG TPA: O-antigen ligase family protein [Planctomycetota bacterium]